LPERRIVGERWRPSEESFVKINFDVAFHKQSNSSCSGIVTVQFGLDLGIVKAEIEGDALSVIKKVQYGNIDKSKISAYVLSTKMLSFGYKAFLFKHTSRMDNKVAHALAVEGLKRAEVTHLQNGFPQLATIEAEEDCQREEVPLLLPRGTTKRTSSGKERNTGFWTFSRVVLIVG
ncbi:hypothetical protein Goklo_006631, partial [Gossypium klotzschianum]|nr:hypothetical protein [Gossypium klotzschianum]